MRRWRVRWRAGPQSRNCQWTPLVWKLLRSRPRVCTLKQATFVTQNFSRAKIASPPRTGVRSTAIETSPAYAITQFGGRIICISNRNITMNGSTRIWHGHGQFIWLSARRNSAQPSHMHANSKGRGATHSVRRKGRGRVRHVG